MTVDKDARRNPLLKKTEQAFKSLALTSRNAL